jgi:hypothetical protein
MTRLAAEISQGSKYGISRAGLSPASPPAQRSIRLDLVAKMALGWSMTDTAPATLAHPEAV